MTDESLAGEKKKKEKNLDRMQTYDTTHSVYIYVSHTYMYGKMEGLIVSN